MSILIARGVLVPRILRLDSIRTAYDNEYYAAAVGSMASGWHAFLLQRFDRRASCRWNSRRWWPCGSRPSPSRLRFKGSPCSAQVMEGGRRGAPRTISPAAVGRGRDGWRGLFLAVMPVSGATERSKQHGEMASCFVLISPRGASVARSGGAGRSCCLSGALISSGSTCPKKNKKMLGPSWCARLAWSTCSATPCGGAGWPTVIAASVVTLSLVGRGL